MAKQQEQQEQEQEEQQDLLDFHAQMKRVCVCVSNPVWRNA